MVIAALLLFATAQQADEVIDPARIRRELALSVLCQDGVGDDSGGFLDFRPSENTPTLRFETNGVPARLFEQGYVVSGARRARPEGDVFEIVLSGLSYGQRATLTFDVPYPRTSYEIEAHLQIENHEARSFMCMQAPLGPPPGTSR